MKRRAGKLAHSASRDTGRDKGGDKGCNNAPYDSSSNLLTSSTLSRLTSSAHTLKTPASSCPPRHGQQNLTSRQGGPKYY